MNLALLTDGLYVANQLQDADLQQLADLGIKHVVCNRPDAEEMGQPAVAHVAALAAAQGMAVSHVAVTMNGLTVDAVHDFAAWLAQDGTPKLAYCRTGTRSSLLWALVQVEQGKMTAAAAIATAKLAGRDISGAMGLLQQLESQAKPV